MAAAALVVVSSSRVTVGCSVKRTAGRGIRAAGSEGGLAVVVNGGQHDVRKAMSTMQLVASRAAEEKRRFILSHSDSCFTHGV